MARLTTGMNLRGGPGTNYDIVGTANAGEAFPVTGRNQAGDWLRIQTAFGSAWIYGAYAQAEGPAAVIAVVSAPPPPTPTP